MPTTTHGHQGGNAWGPCQEPGCGELLAHSNHEVPHTPEPCVEDCADNAAGDFDHVHED